MTTTNEMMSDRVTEATDRLQARLDTATSRARSILEALPYAALGTAAVTLRRGGRALTFAAGLPLRAAKATWETPRRVSERYEERAERGRQILSRVRGRESVQDVAERTRQATGKVKSAAKDARHSARRSVDAVQDAAEAALNPQDTRPYEERTYEELRDLASEREIEGRSAMKKHELIEALRDTR